MISKRYLRDETNVVLVWKREVNVPWSTLPHTHVHTQVGGFQQLTDQRSIIELMTQLTFPSCHLD